jgi:VanZ family protein
MGALGRAWHTPRSFVVDLLPAALYLALLFWAGLIPLKSLPGPDFELADKMWHLIAFGGLATLLSRVLRHFGRSVLESIAVAASASALLGGLLELLQSLTQYRSADFADLAADALGAALAYVVLRWLAKVGGLLDTAAPA